MKSNKLKYTLTSAALFAAATAAAQSVATENIWSVENQTDYTVGSGEYVKASGYYYKDASGVFHRGPVVNVGTFNLNGIFESNYSASAQSLFGAGTVLGSGELRVGAGIFVSPTTDMSGFNGKISVFADNETRKPAIYFVSSTNNPANASFDITQNGAVSFTNGDYTLNGKIAGAGTLKAEKLSNITLADGTEVVKNSEPAKVVVKGDISEFSGGYAASGNSTIRLETTLADSVKFSGSQGGSLELVGGAGDAKKTVTVSSGTNTTTSGNVYMYGNKAVIAQNSNDAGTLGANGGTIYFGGKNGYSAAEKVSHTFDTTTVTGNTAGNVVVGGKGTGASMEAGADILVDGVKIDSLVAGGAEGASVNGDINVTVKSGTVASLAGGKGGIHTGNTNITVENGSVANIYGGDQHGGQINGDISVNVKDGTVGTIYGANYVSTSEKASDFNGVNGNVKIDVNGGTVNHIRGGINSTNAGDAATAKSKMVLNGNVEVNVSGNAHIGADDGESILATGGSYGSVNGNTTINISDNAVVEGIVAGGASRTDDKGVKSTYINVKGGTLNGDIYGGGLKYSTVTENTNVNISGGTVNANVYGGGATNTTVKGNSNITVSGTAVVNGTLNGGGLNGGTVEGTKTLNIGTAEASYESETALKVADFDKINVQGNSDAKIENITQNLTGAVQGSRTIVADGSKLTVTGNIENTLTDATNSGSFVAGVTGGDAVVNGTVKTVIDGEGTSLHYVYGGNGGNQKVVDGKTSPKGVSKVGAVDLTVNNGKIDMIVASGAMYSDVDGDVNVKVNGGNVGSIFGVGSTNSVGGDVNISVKNATVGHITAAGSGINQATPSVVNGSTNITIGENAVVTEDIYGGGWGDGKSWPTVVKGDSTVTLTSNASVQGTIHGGGWNGQYDIVEGTKTLNIGTAEASYESETALKVADFDKINVQGNSDAKIENITQNLTGAVQGSRTIVADGSKLTVTGNIENTLTDATNSGSFVAGVTGGDAVVNGTVKTVIDGEGTSLHYVYGGNGGNQKVVDGKTSPKGVSKVGAVDLTVNNGKIDMIVASGAMYSDVDGDVNVKVNGGNVGSIFGVGSTNSVGGDVNISVKNATVGHITAAGSGINQATPSVVNGSTNITIGENAVVTEDIYGGGWGDGKSWPTVVKGDSTVTLTSNASVQGTIHGGGWNGQYDIVEGTKTLNIGTADEAYSNASALKVADFDKINVQGGSVATVNGNMSNVVVRKENTKTEILTGALVNVDSTSTAKFEDSNFNDNSVSVYVENPGQNYAAIVEGGIVNVNNVSEFKNSNFKGNVIKSEANVAVAGSNVKGGIINASANSTIKIEGSAFEQNTINAKSNSSYATVYGGILNVNDGATADLVTTKFIGNNVSTTDSYGPVYGGIIRSLGDTTITSVTMDGNTLNTSGKASSFLGALISVANGTTTVSDSDFNNTIMEATKDSPMINGAIYVGGEPGVASSAQVLNVSNSTFSGNKATSSYGVNGSVLYVTGETATANISNSIFENNTAVAGSYKARGGAVANYHGIMTLTDVSFKGNSAESSTVDYAQGGALYARNYNSGARTVLNDVSFNDNTAKNGMGGAVYVEGSEIEFNVSKDATISGNMASDSDGNMSDSRGGFIYMKNYDGSKVSSANFNIFENVKMTIGDGSLNKDSIASSDNTAVINKSGAGSLVVNGSMEYFTGALNVNNGYMEVNNGLGASTVNVASSAKFSLILKSNSLANTDYVNAGTIMLHRGALIDGDSVTMKSYNGEGVVSAFGGSFANGKFTAGASAEIAEQAVTVGPNESDVVTVTKSVTGGGQLSLNFDVSKMSESITITAVNDVKEAAMQSGAISGEVLSAFDVEAQNQRGDFSVVLSSKVGEGLDAAKILAWHSDDSGATWTRLEDAEISYDGLFASMVVEGFSAYAFSVVPEPSTYAAIAGVIALALAAWRRRK